MWNLYKCKESVSPYKDAELRAGLYLMSIRHRVFLDRVKDIQEFKRLKPYTDYLKRLAYRLGK